jgi:serine/threonine-protein kinase
MAEQFLAGRQNSILGKTLGQGASAAVFEVLDGSGKSALKVYEPEFLQGDGGPAERRRLRLQKTLVGHSCPQLVQLLDVCETEQTCFVEMEYAPGIDLDKCLQALPAESVHSLILQLVQSVVFLEARGLVHRDIKPANIRISGDFKSLKLLDLGVLREMDDDESPDVTARGPTKPFIATAQYSSPEYLFWLEQPGIDFWRGLSIYQVGAVLHDMLNGRQLFAEEVASGNRYVLAMAVLQKIPVIEAKGTMIRLAALAARCLTKDLQRRLASVTWSDFDERGHSAAKVAQRVMQLRETGLGQSANAANIHERTLRRDGLAKGAVHALYKRMQDQFRGSQLELIEPAESHKTIRFCIPKTKLIVDTQVEFRWSEAAKNETAEVFARGWLKSRDHQDASEPRSQDISTLTEETMEQVVDALLDHVATTIDLAIDIAEAKGGEILGVVDLCEPKS